jgi:hypothetical protein
MKRLIPAVVVSLVMALPAFHAAAQKKMYKCGSQFQDRPCDGSGPAAPTPAAKAPAPAPATTPVAAKGVSAEESRRQIRCENWGRQLLDLREREKGTKDGEAAQGLAAQRAAAESRMKVDHCDPL